jgi:hypothetical protein
MYSIKTAERTSAGITTTETPTLEEFLQPMVDFLQATYPTAGDEAFQLGIVDHFGAHNLEFDDVEIELPDNLLDSELATRAIMTLLHITGTHDAWVRHAVGREDGGLTRPLRFRLEKKVAWAGDFWKWSRSIVVDHLDGELDLNEARRQIVGLTACLADTTNLVKLDPEVLALL